MKTESYVYRYKVKSIKLIVFNSVVDEKWENLKSFKDRYFFIHLLHHVKQSLSHWSNYYHIFFGELLLYQHRHEIYEFDDCEETCTQRDAQKATDFS